MKNSVKIAVYVVLALSACLFGWRFKSDYNALMDFSATDGDADLRNIEVPEYGLTLPTSAQNRHLGLWGGGLVLSLLGLGLLAAHDFSQWIGTRTVKTLYDDNGEIVVTPDYEKAEEEWGQGNFLEAIRILRHQLEQNPRAQHIALRIAEIYEKDLHNYLAAALEYEEILKQKLPPERWGWAAIHLCNLYNSRLNQPDKAITLLRQIEADYPETAAAEKARTRLSQLEDEGWIAPAAPPSPQPEDSPPFKLPPGFTPKKH